MPALVVLAACASPAFAQDADVRELLDEQRRMRDQLDAQGREIDELKSRLAGQPVTGSGPLAEAVEAYLATRESKGAPLSGFTKAKQKFQLYGFVRLDMVHDTSRPNNTQLPGWILSEDETVNRDSTDDFTMHPRLTRLGLDFDGGAVEPLGGAKVGGKIEIDFYGGGSESRAGLRMRHAYLTLKKDAWQLLAGQTQDLISPLNPVVNNDLVMWGAGNLGDRRPQLRVEYDPELDCGQLFVQAMAGLTGAIDAKDLDGNTFRDGETSGKPTVQGRLAYRVPLSEKGKLEVGVWGHRSEDDPDSSFAGESSFRSQAVGADVVVPLWEDRLWIKGEVWTGENLTDVRGGIFQGVNATTGDEIEAQGGWVELGWKATQTLTVYAGWSIDDPKDTDVGAGGRAKNRIGYAALRWDLSPVEIGIEYLRWTTEFVGLDDGTDDRVGAFIAYKF